MRIYTLAYDFIYCFTLILYNFILIVVLILIQNVLSLFHSSNELMSNQLCNTNVWIII